MRKSLHLPREPAPDWLRRPNPKKSDVAQLWSSARLGAGCRLFNVPAARAYSHLVVGELYLGWEDDSVRLAADYFSDVGSE